LLEIADFNHRIKVIFKTVILNKIYENVPALSLEKIMYGYLKRGLKLKVSTMNIRIKLLGLKVIYSIVPSSGWIHIDLHEIDSQWVFHVEEFESS